MTKPEWGEKRTCPKCGTRFYDLGDSDPVTCIECESAWTPEPILKTKQPVVREEKPAEKEETDDDDEDEDLGEDGVSLDIEDEDEDDDALVVISLDDDKSDVNEIVDASLVKGEE